MSGQLTGRRAGDVGRGVPGVAVSMRYALAEMGDGPVGADAAAGQPGRRLRLPVAARGPTRPPSTASTRSSARTAPRRWPGRRRGSGWTPRSSPRTRSRSCASRRPLARGQRAAHRADVPGAGRDPLRADRLGRRVRLIAGSCRALDDPNRARLLHQRPGEQRGRVRLPAARARLGTNNLPDCSNMCHESSGAALTETIGIGKGTVTLEDISEHAELIVVVGQNPGTNHPRMLAALEEAKQRGAKIVAVNPLPEAGLMRFKNPQKAARLCRPRHRAGRPLPAGPGQRRPGAVRRGQQGAARTGRRDAGRPRPRLHRRAHRRLRRRRRRVARARLGDGRGAQRAVPGADRGVRRRRHRRRAASSSAGRWA